MKIGFVLDDGLDKPDGVQQYITNLGSKYSEHGHQVRYLVGQTTRDDIAGVYSLAKNVRVKFNGNTLSIPLPTSNKKIKEVLKKEKFDVLHVQVPYSPFMGAKVIKYAPKSTTIVGTFHILPLGMLSILGTHLLGIYLRFNLRRFDGMISVSEPARLFARKTFHIDSEVVPNSVDIDKFRRHKKEKHTDELKILFLGRLVYRKGCQQLIKALARLNAGHKLPEKWQLDICGDGVMRKQLQQLVDKNGLTKNVVFHGFVTEKEKIQSMQQAEISVFPALAGESFGIVLIEAMAAGGGIVLGGDNPGYRSVLGDFPESLISASDPQKFADQLGVYIDSKKKRQELFEHQQDMVEQYNTEVVATKLLQFYEACKNTTFKQ